MNKCGNCAGEFGDLEEGLIIKQQGKQACAICPACLAGTKVVKVILRRDADGRFAYDQYNALEMQAKAFGKVG